MFIASSINQRVGKSPEGIFSSLPASPFFPRFPAAKPDASIIILTSWENKKLSLLMIKTGPTKNLVLKTSTRTYKNETILLINFREEENCF